MPHLTKDTPGDPREDCQSAHERRQRIYDAFTYKGSVVADLGWTIDEFDKEMCDLLDDSITALNSLRETDEQTGSPRAEELLGFIALSGGILGHQVAGKTIWDLTHLFFQERGVDKREWSIEELAEMYARYWRGESLRRIMRADAAGKCFWLAASNKCFVTFTYATGLALSFLDKAYLDQARLVLSETVAVGQRFAPQKPAIDSVRSRFATNYKQHVYCSILSGLESDPDPVKQINASRFAEFAGHAAGLRVSPKAEAIRRDVRDAQNSEEGYHNPLGDKFFKIGGSPATSNDVLRETLKRVGFDFDATRRDVTAPRKWPKELQQPFRGYKP